MANGLFNLKQQLQGLIRGAWPNQKTPYVEYLVVAGGGGGGNGSAGLGGGGGAGGLLSGTLPVTAGATLTVTVGGGGTGATASSPGTNGNNSVFSTITSTGGGGGGSYTSSLATQGRDGGSGGGYGQGYSNKNGFGGQGITGQGNSGATLLNNAVMLSGGGGGGAGTIGLSSDNGSSPYFGGNGGAGIASSINGTVTTYAGGGGGGSQAGTSGGTGGVGGGGFGYGANAANSSAPAATVGTVNTGGGGGGTGENYAAGSKAGGSGIAIISYPDTYNAPTTLTGTYTASTSGSGSFSLNGSNQYVTYPQNSAFNLGTNNFTVEGWFNSASFGAGQFIISQWAAASYGYAFSISNSTTITFEYYSGGTYYNRNYTVSTLSTNTWYHIAWVRNSGTTTVYLNGVALSTTSDNNSITSSTQLVYVGVNNDGHNAYWNGNISNLRFVNGTAVYTSNFTPSTKPLTAITNTVLLLSTVSPSAFNDSSTNAFAPTVYNSSTWNQASPFATGLGYKNRVYTWTGSGTVTF